MARSFIEYGFAAHDLRQLSEERLVDAVHSLEQQCRDEDVCLNDFEMLKDAQFCLQALRTHKRRLGTND